MTIIFAILISETEIKRKNMKRNSDSNLFNEEKLYWEQNVHKTTQTRSDQLCWFARDMYSNELIT